MTGVVTRDSAQRRPSDKHRSDARFFLLIADRLSPPTPASCRARSCPSIARSHRCGHSARSTNTALVHRISTEILIEIAPHNALVLENAAQVSNEATVATVTSLQIACQGHQVATRQPVASTKPYPLDDNDSRVRGLLAVFLSRRAINGRNIGSGHKQPLRRRPRRVTRKGRSASGGPA